MPKRDGTGPVGNGPRDGRGRGSGSGTKSGGRKGRC